MKERFYESWGAILERPQTTFTKHSQWYRCLYAPPNFSRRVLCTSLQTSSLRSVQSILSLGLPPAAHRRVTQVVCLRPIETVSAMMSALRDYDHNCFPVVEDCDQRVLLGTVHRCAIAEVERSKYHFRVDAHGRATSRAPLDGPTSLCW